MAEDKTKVYISGGITGVSNYKGRFAEAEEYLRGLGYTPVNPCWLKEGLSWEDYMTIDLAMLDICDFIYLLRGRETSKGAKVELASALEKGKKILLEH